MKNILVAYLTISALALNAMGAERQGSIRGTAVNAVGEVVRGATVFAFPNDGDVQLSAVPGALTDDNGEFVIEHLATGHYRIESMKEEEGYPRSYDGFYKVTEPPIVAITESSPMASTRVRMGPQCAVVTGSVIDQSTEAPVLHAHVRLWHISDPGQAVVIAIKPTFRVMVPPSADIGFEILSDDHEILRTPDGPLHLEPASVRDMGMLRLSRKQIGARVN